MEPNKLFVYGILKRGYSLDLSKLGGKFLGEAVLQPANLYKIGQGVGMLIEKEGKVYGEVFEITDPKVWRWLDHIEGHPYTYMRQQVQVLMEPVGATGVVGVEEHECWTYVHQLPEYLGELIDSGKYENDSGYARG
jgi:gamma-glutamylcyclotransferase (GGCT)/AIG2-like uncharacterized protein YtfP